MKKIFIVLIIGISFYLIFQILPLSLVSIKIKDNTLTSSRMTIIVKEIVKKNNNYNFDFYTIEKKDNNTWVKYSDNPNDDSTLMGYCVDKDNKLEFSFDWENRYGRLSKGEYRIVTSFSNNNKEYPLYIYFRID